MKIELSVIKPFEVSKDFLQGMANRMDVSFYKYGHVMDAIGKVDEIACLLERVEKYRETGNTEWLMDAANFAMIEYMHKGAGTFRATDSNESPGLIHTKKAQKESYSHATEAYKSAQHDEFYGRKQE